MLGQRLEDTRPHFADVVLGIIDDTLFLFVPEHGHRDASLKIRIGFFICFREKLEAFHIIEPMALPFTEGPARLVVANRIS